MAPRFKARVTEGRNLPGSETETTVRGASFGGNLRNLGLDMVGFNYLFHTQAEESIGHIGLDLREVWARKELGRSQTRTKEGMLQTRREPRMEP